LFVVRCGGSAGGLGRYAAADAGKLILDRYGKSVCKPCPADHYLSSKYGMGLSVFSACLFRYYTWRTVISDFTPYSQLPQSIATQTVPE
jgi:hypothetical protein